MNKVILTGRLTKDPEVRVTDSNIPFVFFTLAVNRNQKSDNSNQPSADFISCVAWRTQAELMGKFLDKGSLIGVEGRLQVRKTQTPEGDRYITEVVCNSIEFLETKSDAEARRNSNSTYTNTKTSKTDDINPNDIPVEDDLPF